MMMKNDGKNQVIPPTRYLPQDTAAIWKNPNNKPDNFALWLNSGIEAGPDKKGKFEIKNQRLRSNPAFIFDDKLLQRLQQRQAAQAAALFGADKQHEFHPEWRLIVGIGGESVYETSMTLHSVYGIPYLPASAIKGVARSFYITEKHGFTKEKEPEFCDWFGCPKESVHKEAREGKIVFLDAFPIKTITLEADVMNVHYPEYYSGATAPTDCQNPIPIPFLTLGKQTVFRLRYGVKSAADRPRLDALETWLIRALGQHGIGAKTAVGYGTLQA
jgi:CRISPR-associated protein Cmr6